MQIRLLSEQPFVVIRELVGWKHRSGPRATVPPNFAQCSGFLMQLLNGIQTKDTNGETQYACLLPIRQHLWGSWGIRTSSPPQPSGYRSSPSQASLPPLLYIPAASFLESVPLALPNFPSILSWSTSAYSDPHLGLSKFH